MTATTHPYRPTTMIRTRNTAAVVAGLDGPEEPDFPVPLHTRLILGFARYRHSLLFASQLILVLLSITTLTLVAIHFSSSGKGSETSPTVVVTFEANEANASAPICEDKSTLTGGNVDTTTNLSVTSVKVVSDGSREHQKRGRGGGGGGGRLRGSAAGGDGCICDIVRREDLLATVKTAVSHVFLLPSDKNGTSLIQVLVQDMATRLLDEQRRREEQQYHSSETRPRDDHDYDYAPNTL